MELELGVLSGASADITRVNNLSHRIVVRKLVLVSSELLELSFRGYVEMTYFRKCISREDVNDPRISNL